MKKLITRVAYTRWGIQKFNTEVQRYLDSGYDLRQVKIKQKLLGFRTICYAVVSHPIGCSCKGCVNWHGHIPRQKAK